MTLYPDVQRRAQAELDAVTAGSRLPTYEDKPNLPYINAIVKEVLRWNPVSSAGRWLQKIAFGVLTGNKLPADRVSTRVSH